MSIHVLAINCLLHNPDAFAQQAVRSAAMENFKADPSSQNMMQYLMDGILMRRRTIQRTQNIWDSSLYVRSKDHTQENQQRQSRSRKRTETSTSSATSTRATSERRRLPATNRQQTSTAYRPNPQWIIVDLRRQQERQFLPSQLSQHEQRMPSGQFEAKPKTRQLASYYTQTNQIALTTRRK